MKYLILGADGQLGLSLQDVLKTRKIEHLALSRKDVDITNLNALKMAVQISGASVIINAAAFTNVEQAELDPDDAFLVNELGARNVAISARDSNSRLVHFSTDYVFSGSRTKPWETNSDTNPLSNYGKSKLAGERAVLKEYSQNSMIIRTAWLYSPYGKNFYKTMLNLALKDEESINVVDDQFGQPTNAKDLAFITVAALESGAPAGTYHGSSSGTASWFDFAKCIFQLAGADTNRVIPISSHDYKFKVPRPSYSVLDNSRWHEIGIKPIGPWQDSVFTAFPSILDTLN